MQSGTQACTRAALRNAVMRQGDLGAQAAGARSFVVALVFGLLARNTCPTLRDLFPLARLR